MSDAPPSLQEQIAIPKDLRNQLADFQKALWRIKITEAVLAGIFGLLISFLVVFILERFFPLPPLARLGILLAGTSLAAVFAPYWVRRWVYGHRREEQLARLIPKSSPSWVTDFLVSSNFRINTKQRKLSRPNFAKPP
jgi:hypothetical protein